MIAAERASKATSKPISDRFKPMSKQTNIWTSTFIPITNCSRPWCNGANSEERKCGTEEVEADFSIEYNRFAPKKMKRFDNVSLKRDPRQQKN